MIGGDRLLYRRHSVIMLDRRRPKRFAAIGRDDFHHGHSNVYISHRPNMRRWSPVCQPGNSATIKLTPLPGLDSGGSFGWLWQARTVLASERSTACPGPMPVTSKVARHGAGLASFWLSPSAPALQAGLDSGGMVASRWPQRLPLAAAISFRGFSALQVAGAMAKGEGCRRSSLAHLVSRSPSFPSAHDPAQYSCFDERQGR